MATTNNTNKKLVLNSGCGFYNPERLPLIFQNPSWQEIRVDIDPQVKPDVITSTTDLSHFQNHSVDAVYSSHNLEHLYIHDVQAALKEFVRVLKPNGFVLITLPDLQAIAQKVVEGELDTTAYTSKMGPITAFDMLYGHKKTVQEGNSYMAHNSGFTAKSLGQLLLATGFEEVRVKRGQNYDLWAVGLIQNDNFGFFDWFSKQDMVI